MAAQSPDAGIRLLDEALAPLGFSPAQAGRGSATWCSPLRDVLGRQPRLLESHADVPAGDGACWDLVVEWDDVPPFGVTRVSAEGEPLADLLKRLDVDGLALRLGRPFAEVAELVADAVTRALDPARG
jgi:hypothetical protein